MREIRTSGLMSGDGKRGVATAPILDSTAPCRLRCCSRLRPAGYDGPAPGPPKLSAKAGRRGRYGVGAAKNVSGHMVEPPEAEDARRKATRRAGSTSRQGRGRAQRDVGHPASPGVIHTASLPAPFVSSIGQTIRVMNARIVLRAVAWPLT